MVVIDAQETLRQLGGNKFIVMTGAKDFVKGQDFISFRIPKAFNNINFVRIVLTDADTYVVEFGKVVKFDYKVVKVVRDVYDDQLQSVFTAETHLYTHL